jgi:hypothetical protein
MPPSCPRALTRPTPSGQAMVRCSSRLSGLNLPPAELAQIQADYLKNATEIWNQSLQRLQGARARPAAAPPATAASPARMAGQPGRGL